jgi:hypothetical protein
MLIRIPPHFVFPPRLKRRGRELKMRQNVKKTPPFGRVLSGWHPPRRCFAPAAAPLIRDFAKTLSIHTDTIHLPRALVKPALCDLSHLGAVVRRKF